MVLVNEEDKSTELLKTKISSSSSLSRQRGMYRLILIIVIVDTIITWMDDENM